LQLAYNLCSALTSLDMQGNSLVGNLPPEWGSAVAFPRLSKLYLGLNNSLTGELALVAFGGGRLWPVDRQWAARAAWSSAAVPGTACNSFPHALYYHPQAPCPRAGATTGHSRH